MLRFLAFLRVCYCRYIRRMNAIDILIDSIIRCVNQVRYFPNPDELGTLFYNQVHPEDKGKCVRRILRLLDVDEEVIILLFHPDKENQKISINMMETDIPGLGEFVSIVLGRKKVNG